MAKFSRGIILPRGKIILFTWQKYSRDKYFHVANFLTWQKYSRSKIFTWQIFSCGKIINVASIIMWKKFHVVKFLHLA